MAFERKKTDGWQTYRDRDGRAAAVSDDAGRCELELKQNNTALAIILCFSKPEVDVRVSVNNDSEERRMLMRVSTLMTISLCVAVFLGCSDKAALVQGPANSVSDIQVGIPKNEIVQRLGKPLKWATIKRTNKEMNIIVYFDLNAAMGEMPADEPWLFEYSLADGRKYAIHFLDNKVKSVVVLLKDLFSKNDL